MRMHAQVSAPGTSGATATCPCRAPRRPRGRGRAGPRAHAASSAAPPRRCRPRMRGPRGPAAPHRQPPAPAGRPRRAELLGQRAAGVRLSGSCFAGAAFARVGDRTAGVPASAPTSPICCGVASRLRQAVAGIDPVSVGRRMTSAAVTPTAERDEQSGASGEGERAAAARECKAPAGAGRVGGAGRSCGDLRRAPGWGVCRNPDIRSGLGVCVLGSGVRARPARAL